MTDRLCVECSCPVARVRSDFCSDRCGDRWRHRSRYQQRKRAEIRPCVTCAEPTFFPNGSGKRCQPCKDRLGLRFGGRFDLRSGAIVRHSDPAVRRVRDKSLAKRLRAIVLAEESDCAICSRPLDPDAPPRTRWASTVDHIVALADGGSDDRSNLQAAHHGCNAKKEATRRWERRVLADLKRAA